MNMQKRLRGLTLAVGLMFTAFISYADTVTVSTYYPSPFGSYFNLDTSGETHLATTTGLNVGIGAVGVPAEKLVVSDTIAAGFVRTRVQNLAVDGASALALGAANEGLVRGNAASAFFPDQMALYTATAIPLTFYTNTTQKVIITSAGDVGIGNAAPARKLDVTGTARITGALNLTSGVNSGDLRVSCNGIDCYAVYAP